MPDSSVREITAPILSKNKKEKAIYLTFDDGHNKGSRKVMHIAQEGQATVSTVIIGEHV